MPRERSVSARSRGALAALALLVLAACGGGGTPVLGPAPGESTPAATVGTVAAVNATSPIALVTASPRVTAPVAPATVAPSPTATVAPVAAPTATAVPTPPAAPTRVLTPAPTVAPTTAPAAPPTVAPTPRPTMAPTVVPVGKARTIDRGVTSRRMVALTFDAGADRGFAGRILDTLRDTGVKASFGMTGKWAEQNPDLVQRMVREGHLLINHTYDHASFTGFSPKTTPLTAEERRREIERTETVVRAVAGVGLSPYFRPPYGDYDEALLAQLGQLGYGYNVMWTVDSLGWNGYSAERIVARCVAGATPGAILLFHVGAESQDAAALPELIRQLKAAGYAFGTVADIVKD